MKAKRILAAVLAVSTVSLFGCSQQKSTDVSSSGETESGTSSAQSEDLSYANVELGTSYKDLKADIKFLTHRTDMQKDDYSGKNWKSYIAEFNKKYPNITVNIEGITDYANNSLLRLQGGSDWGDIMMIPAVDKADLSTYFMPLGSLADMQKQIRFAHAWEYKDVVYGVPSVGNAQGIVYNKRIFKEAGITELPKTPDEFLSDLKLVKDKTKATPLYTNYFAQWTMGAWDGYLSGSTGNAKYMNQELLHKSNPFSNPGDSTGPYNVYKILYDAVKGGLIEKDYTTTDWESSKTKINNGDIACMVLGSWAYSQMVGAGSHGDDIGYMPFPITVGGKQYASSGADYSFGINVNSSKEKQEASMVFVKWMTEESGFAYNEGGIPIKADDNKYPDVFSSFQDIELVEDEPAAEGEEDLFNKLNADSELNINNSGNDKIMKIVEHASNGDESFDDIMKDWNAAWTKAQQKENVTVS